MACAVSPLGVRLCAAELGACCCGRGGNMPCRIGIAVADADLTMPLACNRVVLSASLSSYADSVQADVIVAPGFNFVLRFFFFSFPFDLLRRLVIRLDPIRSSVICLTPLWTVLAKPIAFDFISLQHLKNPESHQ